MPGKERRRKKEEERRKKKKSRVYRTAKLVLSKDMSIGNVVEYVRVYVMVEYMFGGVIYWWGICGYGC